MNRNERLQKAGIPVQLEADSIPFSVWVDPISINNTFALHPASYGNLEERIRRLGQYARLPFGLPPLAISSFHVHKDTSLVDALLESMKNDDRELAPVARWHVQEVMRGDFRRWVMERNSFLAFEGMDGLARLGLEESDIPLFVEQVLLKDDIPRSCFALAILAEQGKLQEVVESGAINTALDDNEMIASLVDFGIQGSLPTLEKVFSLLDHWAQYIGVLRLVKAVASKHASFDLLDLLLQRSLDNNDNDVIVSFSWAIGVCVRALGFDSAEHLLKHCRDNLNDNQGHLCFLINGALRYSPSEEEGKILLGILNDMSFDDTDVTRSIGRVRDHISKQSIASNWLFRGGYGRGVDIFEYNGGCVPQDVLLTLSAQENSNPLNTIEYMHRVQSEAIVIAQIASRLLHFHPECLSVFTKWVFGDVHEACKIGVAMALCMTSLEHSVSPVFLRCRVGLEVGGPLPEAAGSFGELMAYYEDWNLRDTVKELIYISSASLRQQAAAYFHGRTFFDTSDDIRTALLRTGVLQAPQKRLNISSACLQMSAGLKFDCNALIEELKMQEKPHLSLFREWFMNADRDEMIALASRTEFWALFDLHDVCQLALALLSHRYNNPKEIGSLICHTVGKDILQGDNAKHIRSKLLSLVNDSSSYVADQAKKACTSLALDMVIINPETLRHNILNGGSELDTWIDRLFTFVQEANDVGELRQLARLKALWDVVGIERLIDNWFSWARSDNWIHREIACILVATFDTLLSGEHAQDVFSLMQSLSQDDDGDVRKEARLACDVHGIEYTP